MNEKSPYSIGAFALCEAWLDGKLVDEKGIEPSAPALRRVKTIFLNSLICVWFPVLLQQSSD